MANGTITLSPPSPPSFSGVYGDAEIIDALKAAYAENVPDDPKMIGLIERPASVRLGMAARGAAVFPISDLDRTFGSGWSLFR